MTYDELTHLSAFLKQLRSDCMSRHVESCDCVDGVGVGFGGGFALIIVLFILLIIIGASFCGGYGGGVAPVAPAYGYGAPIAPVAPAYGYGAPNAPIAPAYGTFC